MTLIIGVTGLPCSGNDDFGRIMQENQGYLWLSYSDVLRKEAKRREIEILRGTLQDLGDEMRQNQGAGILSEILIKEIIPEKNYCLGNIRNPGEVYVLNKKFNKAFSLVWVDALSEIRFSRMKKRNREGDPQTMEEFIRLEKKDLGIGQPWYGQQHGKVFEMADYRIENNGTIEEFRVSIKELLNKIKLGKKK